MCRSLPVPDRAQPRAGHSAIRLSGPESLSERAPRKFNPDEFLITGSAGRCSKMEFATVTLWRGNHVRVRQELEHFARYI